MEQETPERRRIVVDGSNIATEGRSLPSLAQLDEAIRSFLDEYPGFTTSDVTVVVDASFGHRIDPSEVPAFDQAIEHGEMVTPPAGAVGRGDGFILRIAEKSGALVLSNDSFQEFHVERPWLFEPGRLIGGKPVPGVGWIFTPRTPVRGAKSRAVTSKSKRGTKAAEAELADAAALDGADIVLLPDEAEGARPSRRRRGAKAVAKTASTTEPSQAADGGATEGGSRTKAKKAVKTTKAAKASKATAEGTQDTEDGAEPSLAAGPTKRAVKAVKAVKAAKTAPVSLDESAKAAPARRSQKSTKEEIAVDVDAASFSDGGGSRARSNGKHEALNDPLTFLTFVAAHPVGSEFDGTVVSFTSHGAHVEVGGMLCHVPLRGLADPAPNKARQVVSKGETRTFVLVSLDAPSRRAELALPGVSS